MKLFIVGNGMDIDHGYMTKWSDIFDANKLEKIKSFKSMKLNYLLSDQLREEGNKLLWKDFEMCIQDMVRIFATAFLDFSDYYKDTEKIQNYSPNEVKIAHSNIWNEMYTFFENNPNFSLVGDTVDITIELKNILIEGIQTAIKGNEVIDPLVIKFWENIFADLAPDDVIINYNYTTVYNDSYFKKTKKILNIHGVIDEKTDSISNGGGFYNSGAYDIKLGTYDLCPGFSSAQFRNFDNLDVYDIDKYIESIGLKNQFFQKTIQDNSNDKSSTIFFKNIGIVDEIIVIGHSLGSGDLTYLTNFYNCVNDNLDKSNRFYNTVTKVKYIGYWEFDDDLCVFRNKLIDMFDLDSRNVQFSFINNKYKQCRYIFEI